MLIVTFIRHGESEDNLRGVWAGWKDAPLSPLGRKQAYALGQSFKSVNLDAIYTSDLKRAHSTALAIIDARSLEERPPLTVDSKFREQHFGQAEGNKWALHPPSDIPFEELFKQGIYPVLYDRGRDAKFPEGESLTDLANRCEQGLRDRVLPHLNDLKDSHIAFTSHGLCISELISALLRWDPESRKDISYTGLFNTAWTRVVITVRDGHEGDIDAHNPPALEVRVLDVNNKDHLVDLEEVAGPIPEEKDEASAEAKAFFSGAHLKEN